MKRLTTDQIRRSYLDFFKSKGHTEWPSDSLIPADDPTLLFSGAGMNQFKDMFLGKGTLPFSRATTAQKCLRTGDLDNVGRTDYHHTFFEMMGNFSFGDYFKKDAIEWAFEWLTSVLEVPKDRLYFSVYLDDDEAWGYWESICRRNGMDPDLRIFRLGAHDNFWPADAPTLGPNGPCGPCSEIFFDQEPSGCQNERVDITAPGGRFVEIWNLVFTQFDRVGFEKLEPLPQKNIDTGLGLERMAAVMQGVRNNFDIDIFVPLKKRILAQFCDSRPFESLDAVGKQCVRRIADHIRAVAFCICDGAMPSNAERGYVVRRLIRRAYLDVCYLTGAYDRTGLAEILPTVVEVMGGAYPDLERRFAFTREILSGEEADFIRTLNSNERRLQSALAEATTVDGVKVVSGDTAFKLFDTYGMPVEVMEDYFDRLGAVVDREAFNTALESRRSMSREGSKMKGDIFDLGPLGKAFDVTTETVYLGQSVVEADEMRLLMMFRDNEPVASASKGDKVVCVFNRTPFYGESGGEIGDTGEIWSKVARLKVTDTTKIKKVFYHFCEVVEGCIDGTIGRGYPTFDAVFYGSVEVERRRAIERNHTATHLLHYALREVLGRHCEQAGSLVEHGRLRFDFTHFSPLSSEQISRIERIVNEKIVANHPLVCYTDTLENARKSGVIALFGEKYEDTVRIVDIGGFSKELCGGCHVRSTGEIGSLSIFTEEAVAAGMRRITALTGLCAVEHARENSDALQAVSSLLGVKSSEAYSRISTLLDESKSLRSDLRKLKEKMLREGCATATTEDIGGIPVIALDLGEAEPDLLRNVMDSLKSRVGEGAMLLASHREGAVSLLVYVSDPLVAKGWKAGDLIRNAAEAVGGKGGGRPQLAQAGGKNPDGLPVALSEFRKAVAEMCKRTNPN